MKKAILCLYSVLFAHLLWRGEEVHFVAASHSTNIYTRRTNIKSKHKIVTYRKGILCTAPHHHDHVDSLTRRNSLTHSHEHREWERVRIAPTNNVVLVHTKKCFGSLSILRMCHDDVPHFSFSSIHLFVLRLWWHFLFFLFFFFCLASVTCFRGTHQNVHTSHINIQPAMKKE